MPVVALDVGRALGQSFDMCWATLWALVAGFTLSGAVQAFVPRQRVQDRIGRKSIACLVRSGLYGAASSSCSYAASALARSLFAGGADFMSAMVFMFASTNLVVELGLALVVLMGWQFLAAEYIGGTIMICLLVLGGAWWLGGVKLSSPRRDRSHAVVAADARAFETAPPERPWRTAAGWAGAAGYTVGDITMLRKEIAAGFLGAGFLTVLVPRALWQAAFWQGHGTLTSVENAAVGPLVAAGSFVCSVGNIPLAATFWREGVSFGGVVSFIFGDLITVPLLLIYRKQYGGRTAVRMFVLFWMVMSLAGLSTEYLAKATGLLPGRLHRNIGTQGVGLNVTSALDVCALVLLVALYWLHRHGARYEHQDHYTNDPVCGMQLDKSLAAARFDDNGRTIYFCSNTCRLRYGAAAGRAAPP